MVVIHPIHQSVHPSTSLIIFSRNLLIVYCESVNLIGYFTVDYLLIVYGNIVACVIVRVIVHMILFLHALVHMARHTEPDQCNIMKQSFSTRYLTFLLFLCNETTVNLY